MSWRRSSTTTAESVRPVPVAVADRQVAVRCDLVGARADDRVHPPLRAAPERGAQDWSVQATMRQSARAARPVPATAVLARPTPRTWTACSRSRTRGLRARNRSSGRGVGRVIVRLAHRTRRRGTNPSQVRSSSSAASNAARERTRSWSSIRSSTEPPVARSEAPHPDRVRHVAQVEVAGRGRSEAGQRPARECGEVSGRRDLRRPARPALARGRDRAPRARAWPPSAGGRAPGDRPAGAARRWPS